MKNKILIVDDSKDIVEIIVRLLKRQKWYIEIKCAYDGCEAEARITSFLPDLVILDINIPIIDGYEIIRNIKSNRELRNIKILAISGKDISDNKEKTLSYGIEMFMVKPFNFEEIIPVVAKLLNLTESTGSYRGLK